MRRPVEGTALLVAGHGAIGGPIAGIVSIVMGLGVLSFAVNLWLKGFPLPANQSEAARLVPQPGTAA